MKRICLAFLLIILTACAAPRNSDEVVAPEPVFEGTGDPDADPCVSTGDGIGGTGCPVD